MEGGPAALPQIKREARQGGHSGGPAGLGSPAVSSSHFPSSTLPSPIGPPPDAAAVRAL